MFNPVPATSRPVRLGIQTLFLSLLLASGQHALAQAPTGSDQSEAQIPLAGDAIQVNVNEADAATLADVLVGIGPARARAIVEFREQHGRFENLNDLVEVQGVGAATVFNNKDRIRFE